MKSSVRNNFPILNISDANFSNSDLKIFQKEVSKAIKYGLFPFAKDFKTSKADSLKNIFSFTITCQIQGGYGDPNEFDIRQNDAFIFAFLQDDLTQEFRYLSTNLSSQLFAILLISCDKTSRKLSKSLQNTDYAIAKETPSILSSYLKRFFPNQNLAKKLVLYIFENIALQIHLKPDSTRNYDEVIKSVISRLGTNEDFEKIKAEFYDPLSKKRCEYIAKYEIISQLQDAQIFNDLPQSPIIIDVGSGNGLNTLEIQKYLPNAKILGIEARKIESYESNKIGVLSYPGFVEDVFELNGKADLVTVFNANPRSNPSDFYLSISKLLKKNGKAIIGVDALDSPITSNGKTVYENLNQYFSNIIKLPNSQNFIQDLYIASNPKEILKENGEFLIKYIKDFIGNKEFKDRIRIGEKYGDVILREFLCKIGSKA